MPLRRTFFTRDGAVVARLAHTALVRYRPLAYLSAKVARPKTKSDPAPATKQPLQALSTPQPAMTSARGGVKKGSPSCAPSQWIPAGACPGQRSGTGMTGAA